jgi:O-methyltransferase
MGYARYFGRLVKQGGFSIAKGVALPLVRRDAVRSGAHELAFPIATYAPWRSDSDFQRVYEAVRRQTLVDVWRCYELWSLLGELRDVPGAIIEVGVWRGGTGVLLAARAAGLGIDDRVYLCDTWRGVVKTGEIDTYYQDGKHKNASSADVERLVDELGLSNVELLEGIFPEETGGQIPEQTFRLCHCDVDVYRSARDVIDWVWPRLASGGAVVFDDYGFPACPGVTKLVDEQRMREDRLVLHNLNGHGIVLKR